MTSILVAICRISRKKFKQHYLQKKKLFLEYLLHFWILQQIWKTLQNKMSFLAEVCLKLLTPKEVVTWRPCFKIPFANEGVHGIHIVLKSARHHYYFIALWIGDKLSCKKSTLVKFKLVGLLVHTLTADDKYSSRNIQNLTQELQTVIYQKQKAFYRIFITYLKARRSSDDFAQKDESPSFSIY